VETLSPDDVIAKMLPIKDQRPSDEEFLAPILHPKGVSSDCPSSNNTYRWYYALCNVLRPDSIAEIGVLFGYSLYSMAVGAGTKPKLYGIDMEAYVKGCLQHARERLAPVSSSVNVVEANSQSLTKLPWTDLVDVFHVDGDHSENGCKHDMGLAWGGLKPGGWMIVDDTSIFHLENPCREFASREKARIFVHPTLRGWALIVKPS
jgi:predicted O-methyltransferase YrrM